MPQPAFKQIVFEATRQTSGRVAGIIEPGVTPNFVAARIETGTGSCYLLCSHAGDWAFARAIEPALAPLEFIDYPDLAEALASLFGIKPLARAELDAPFTNRPGLSASDIRYWRPRTLGDALFNWWD